MGQANLGISLPGIFEEPKAPVYMDREHHSTLRGDNIGQEFRNILDHYVMRNYGRNDNSESVNKEK